MYKLYGTFVESLLPPGVVSAGVGKGSSRVLADAVVLAGHVHELRLWPPERTRRGWGAHSNVTVAQIALQPKHAAQIALQPKHGCLD